MNDFFNYLDDCLNKTFYKYPKMHLMDVEFLLNTVIKKTILDVNYKYIGRMKIYTEQELVELIQVEPTIEAVSLYRLERELFLRDSANLLLPFLASLMHRRTGSEIYYSTKIGTGFNIQHGYGIVIGPRYEIGNNFTIHQGVTLGQKKLNSPNERIIIGDNVTIFAGAKVLGDIVIGDNSMIAANAVVITDVESNSIYGGIPAKKLNSII